jgi:hypothetical protein
MANVDELTLSLTARIVHQLDFAFQKNTAEIANDIRQKVLEEPAFGGPKNILGVSLDEENDINVRTTTGTLYVTDRAVMVVGQLVILGNLAEDRYTKEIVRTIEWLFAQRNSFQAESYEVRLFFWTRTIAREYVEPLETCLNVGLKSILGGASGSKCSRISANYSTGQFSDFLELELTNEAQLRYSREASATKYKSYESFLQEANLAGTVEALRPLLKAFAPSLPPTRVPE